MKSFAGAVKTYIENALNQKFLPGELDSAISGFSESKKLKDVGSFRPEMVKFLERFSPADRKKEENIEAAYYYAKGRAMGNTVRKIVQEGETRKRIILNSSSSKPKQKGAATDTALTPYEKKMADRADLS